MYIPFLSTNYDLNGVGEAVSLEAGHLFTPNHMLYRPLASLVYGLLRVAGYDGRSLEILQIITSIGGALGVGFAYLAFYRLTDDRVAALAGCLWWGTSWAYWFFSTDVSYIVPAAALVAATLALSVRVDTVSSAAVLGLLLGLSILAWEANVFLIPALILQQLLTCREDQRVSRFAVLTTFLATCVLLVGLGMLGVGYFVYGHKAPSQFVHWLLQYGVGRLPMWGTWSVERFRPMPSTLVGSWLPLTNRLDPGEFLGVTVEKPGICFLVSVLALCGLTIVLIAQVIRKTPEGTKGSHPIVWIAGAYALFLPFVFWWDPYEAKWLVIPNLFLAAMIAVLISGVKKFATRTSIFTCILVVAGSNLVTTIWPRHAERRYALQLAQCVAERMEDRDLFVATDWAWAGYLRYLYHRRVLSLIDVTAMVHDKDAALAEMRKSAALTQARHGKVYIIDLASYRPHHIGWLGAQTGLTPEDLNALQSSPAFLCGSTKFRVLEPVPLKPAPVGHEGG